MSTPKSIILAVVCLLGGLAIGFNLSEGDARTTYIRWKYGNSELVIDLDKDMADDETLLGKIFSTDFSASGAEAWLKTQRQLYRFDDPALATLIGGLEYDAPAAREYRSLKDRRIGPWAYQTQEVRVGIPARNYQPSAGNANVCESGIFYRHKIEVFLPSRPDHKVVLNASGRYACPQNYEFPDIQLSHEDAKYLFGYDNFSKYETAAAIVIQE